MSKVKKLTIALLVLVIGLFAGFTLVGCGDDAPTVTDLSETATLSVADVTYGGTPKGVVKYKDKVLIEGKDYDIEFGDYSKVSDEVIATVTFKGKYKGSITDTFAVKAYNASAAIVSLANANEKIVYTQDEAGAIPSGIVVTYAGQTVDASNYEVVYDNCWSVGTAKVIVIFKGNYTGSTELEYTIEPFEVTAENSEFTIADFIVGNEPVVQFEVNGYTLNPETDYTIDLGDYSKANESVTATITFKGNFAGTITETYAVKPIEITPTITLDVSEYRYDGNAKTPTVTVQANGTTFAESDYDVEYENNVNAGVATVTVTMKGNYSGSATATFNIIEYVAVELTASVEKQEIVGATRELFDMPDGAINDAKIKVASGANEYEVKLVNGKMTVDVPANASYDITAEWNGYKATASAQITTSQSINLEFKSGFKLGGTVRGKGEDGKDYEYVSYAKDSYSISGDTISFNRIGWAYLNTEATDKYYLETQLKLTTLGSMIGFLAASEFGNLSNDADKVLQGPSDKLRQKFVLAFSGGSGKILFHQHTNAWNTNGLVNMGVTGLGHASDAKFAVLRDGNDYYVFINDKYAGSYTTDKYGKSGFGFASTDDNKKCVFANVKTTTSSAAVDAIKEQLVVPTLGGFYTRENGTVVGGIGNITINEDGKSGTVAKDGNFGGMAMLSDVTGSVYYVEATFEKGKAWKGLVVNTMDTHQPKENLGWLAFGMLGTTMYMHDYDAIWSRGTNVASKLTDTYTNDIKFGVARINDWYYVYVNDALVVTKQVSVWSARMNNGAQQKMAVLPADNESGVGVYCGTNVTGTATFNNFNYTFDVNEVAKKVGGAVINYDSNKYVATQCGNEVKTGSYLLPEVAVTVTSLDGTAVKVFKNESAIVTSASENGAAFVPVKGASYSVGLYSDENVTLSIAITAKELIDTVDGKQYNIFKDYAIDPQYLQVKISDGTTESVYDAISSNPIINGLEAKQYTIKVVYAGIEYPVTKTLNAGDNEVSVTIDPVYLGGHVVANKILYQPFKNIGLGATSGGNWSLVDGKRDAVSMANATFVMQHGVVGTNYYVEGTFDSTNDLGVRTSVAGLMVAHGTDTHLNDVPSDYRLIATIYGDHIILCLVLPGGWSAAPSITIADVKAMGITVADATKVRLGVIRENTTYHFFVDGQYVTTYVVPEIDKASGFGTARCGGGNAFTVSNFRYSTSSEYIGALKATMPKEKEIDLYFIAGQSNGSGYSSVQTGSALYSAEGAATGYGNILYAGDAESTSSGATKHNAFNWQVARIGMGKTTSHIGVEVGFAQTLASQYTTSAKTAAIIKMAHGGTALQDNVGGENAAGGNWTPPTYLEQNGKKDARYSGGMYYKLIAEAEKRIAELKAMGYTKINFKGLFWMQGESDRTNPSGYKNIMKTFIADVRNDLGEVATNVLGTDVDLSKMPIYIGEISETFGANETTKEAYDSKCNINKTFIAMQNQLAKEVNDVYVVPSGSYVICEWNGSSVTIKGTDQSHWSFDSMVEIGKAWGNMVKAN